MTEDWCQAREDVFLAALALHRAFIESHPAEMLANLNLASDWLQGRRMPEIMARTALDALCLVVPVISTTFASVPRMFADIGREGIGWLLIDEAGQALAQQPSGSGANAGVLDGAWNQGEKAAGDLFSGSPGGSNLGSLLGGGQRPMPPQPQPVEGTQGQQKGDAPPPSGR